MASRFVLACCLALCLGWGQAVAAAGPPAAAAAKLTAENIDYQENGQVVEAHGQVVFTYGREKITCDHLRHDKVGDNVEAWGKVVWHHQGDVLYAERLKLNLATKLGKAFEARVLVTASHFYLSGREIDKTGEESYSIKDCTITTCDGSRPDWIVRATTVNLTVNGYGHLYNPRFHMGPVPVFYLPYAIVPLKRDRQSGFLPPTVFFSGRDGFAWELAFYWAFADWGDLTLYHHHSYKRGEGVGAGLDFMLGQVKDRGVFYFDYLDDARAKYHYEKGDNQTDINPRYWFRGMMRATELLPGKVGLNVRIDRPSDPDLIREFDYWENGLAVINRKFRDIYGQTLQDATENERLSTVNLTKSWSGASAGMEFRYRYNTVPGSTDSIVQWLPRMTYNFSDKQILKSNVYYNFAVEALNAYRVTGDRGQQLDGSFNVYTPLTLGPYLSFQPSLGAKATYWKVDPNGADATNFEELRQRYYWYGSMDMSTSFFKVYDYDGVEWKKIKHSVTPRIFFTYIPRHHDPAPDFVGTTAAEEKLNFILTTSLTAKRTQGVNDLLELQEEMWRRRYLGAVALWSTGPDKYVGTSTDDLKEEYDRLLRLNQLQTQPKYNYDEFLRLELRETLDLRAARLPLSEGGSSQPFLPLKANLRFQPSRFFNTQAEAEYQPYVKDFTSLTIITDITDARGDFFGLQYRRTFDVDNNLVSVNQLRALATVKVSGPWSAGADLIYNLQTGKSISQTYNVAFQRQCWGIVASYYRASDDHRFGLTFSLLGVGGVYRYERKLGAN